MKTVCPHPIRLSLLPLNHCSCPMLVLSQNDQCPSPIPSIACSPFLSPSHSLSLISHFHSPFLCFFPTCSPPLLLNPSFSPLAPGRALCLFCS
jgi:hypothetical protein